jgi:thiamine-phosphate pyrophosphorylase
MKKELLQIMDANYNRAKEAMRVSEDILRFVSKNAALTAQWKRTRHELTRILLKFPVSPRALLESRNSRQDVGRKSLIRDKKRKIQWADLLLANAKRGEEAVRVLEELSKIISPRQTPQLQHLRFRLYELEKKSLRKL